MKEKRKIWIIGICCTDGDGVDVDKINGTTSEVKEYLLRLVRAEKADNKDAWDSGTEKISEIEEIKNSDGKITSLYAYNVFSDYHTDYQATLEEVVVTGEIFTSAKDMLARVQKEDFYNMVTEEYVFGYNDAGSIAVYNIGYDEARELQKKVEESDEEYWGAFLGAGGRIWDDESHEDKPAKGCSNLDYCKANFKKEGWVLCSNIPAKENTHED